VVNHLATGGVHERDVLHERRRSLGQPVKGGGQGAPSRHSNSLLETRGNSGDSKVVQKADIRI
jgi:hypothetical protein